jgi:hypothetical protein
MTVCKTERYSGAQLWLHEHELHLELLLINFAIKLRLQHEEVTVDRICMRNT